MTAASLNFAALEEVYVPDCYLGLNGVFAGNEKVVVISSYESCARAWAKANGLAWRHDVHTWGEGVITLEPTCATAGEQINTCTLCGAVEPEVLPPAHSWANGVLTVRPSGTEAGEMAYSCLLCGERKTVEVHQGVTGDPNDDGVIDMLDVIDTLEWFCGGAVELNLANADVTGDGVSDMLDIITVLEWYCGAEVKLVGPTDTEGIQ